MCQQNIGTHCINTLVLPRTLVIRDEFGFCFYQGSPNVKLSLLCHTINININLSKSEGYNFCVYDDLEAIGVEHPTDVHVEFVKLVDGLSRAHVPQHTIIQYQVIGRVEGGTVPLVVVGQVWVI